VSKRARTGLVLLGILVLLTGLFLWVMESEYGADLNFSIVYEDQTATVYEESAGQVAQFDSNEEAVAYTDERRAEATNYLLPGLVISAGAVLVVVGLAPFRSGRQEAAPHQ